MKRINKSFKDLKVAVICADNMACGNYRIKICYQDLINKGYNQFKIFEQQPSFNELKDFDIILGQRLEYAKQNFKKRYHGENKKQLVEKSKKYYSENKEKKNEYDKLYHIKNREQILLRMNNNSKLYREKNKDQIYEKQKEYRKNNKDKINEKKRVQRSKKKSEKLLNETPNISATLHMQ